MLQIYTQQNGAHVGGTNGHARLHFYALDEIINEDLLLTLLIESSININHLLMIIQKCIGKIWCNAMRSYQVNLPNQSITLDSLTLLIN